MNITFLIGNGFDLNLGLDTSYNDFLNFYLQEKSGDDEEIRGFKADIRRQQKQKAWLSDQRFAEKFGFRAVDTAGEYVLLALSFDGTLPRFTPGAKAQTIENRDLTVYYDDQCPFIFQRVEKLKEFCAQKGLPAQFIHVESVEQAKALPCVFNNWAVFYDGKFATVNQIGGAEVERFMKRAKER